MNEAQLIFFIVTSLIVILVPGQDMVLIMSRGVAQGSKAGLATAAGVSVGLIGHTLFATLGLGALMMASNTVFSFIKYVGAAYLIFLGLQLIFLRTKRLELNAGVGIPFARLFATGALSNISNPKITIFYFAYLPQFISSDIQDPTYMLLTLGVIFAVLTFIVKGPIGYLAGRFSKWLHSHTMVLTWINRTSGTALVCLGVKLAFEQR